MLVLNVVQKAFGKQFRDDDSTGTFVASGLFVMTILAPFASVFGHTRPLSTGAGVPVKKSP